MMLTNKTILIIGGSTGLGLAAARACRAAGARLMLVGRSQASLDGALAEFGDAAIGLAGDAMDSATAPAAIKLALDHFGSVDALYHVAGGSGRKHGDGPLHELTDAGLAFTLQSNLHALIYSNRAMVQHWLAQGRGGSILNVGSILGQHPAPHHFATHAYAAAKSGAVGFTTSCAACYAKDGIRFNLLTPALVETPMSQRAVGNAAIMSYIKTKQPLDGGRIGQPEDLDAAVVFFLSDASRFVTGQVLAVDGGWSVSEGQYLT